MFAAIVASSLLLIRVGSRRLLCVLKKVLRFTETCQSQSTIFIGESMRTEVYTEGKIPNPCCTSFMRIFILPVFPVPYSKMNYGTALHFIKISEISFNVFIQKHVCETDIMNTVNRLTVIAINNRV